MAQQITFTELNRTGEIVLGRYDNARGLLGYEFRYPLPNGNSYFERSTSLEFAASIYWQKVAALTA